MNQYPLWKNVLVVVLFLVGALYALPNLYGEDPALQISARRGDGVAADVRGRLDAALAEKGFVPLAVEDEGGGLLVRFADTDQQLRARDVVATALGDDYTVALNLAPATPDWLRAIGGRPMYLGLDLRGGVHFLMQVDTAAVARQNEERLVGEIRATLRDEKLRYRGVSREAGTLRVEFADAATREAARPVLRRRFPQLAATEVDEGGMARLDLVPGEDFLAEMRRLAVQQNVTTLRNRVDELGVAEPLIQQQGDDRIVVQLPGVQDTARAKEILGATATLEFRMVDQEGDVAAAEAGRVPIGSRLYRSRDDRSLLLMKRVMLTGDRIVDASAGFDPQTREPLVSVTLDGQGGRLFSEATRDNVGRPMAVVFIENVTTTEQRGSEQVKVRKTVEEVINVATIRERLSDRFQISGLDSSTEAHDLALLLRAGSLAAPIDIVEERTIGPSLGQGNITMGWRACLIGFLTLAVFLVVYYRAFGLFAVVSLAYNVILLIALLSFLQATLTLPGIAGVLLTVGTAVDANVLIYERIREELRNGVSVQAAIEAGFTRATDTITDSNVTVLIAALMLLWFGTGPIRGFAVTLAIGTVLSMYTAVVGTRAQVNWFYGGRRVRQLLI